MDDKETKECSERYAQLLVEYAALLPNLEKILKRLGATRKELLYLETKMKSAGIEIKEIEKDGDNTTKSE